MKNRTGDLPYMGALQRARHELLGRAHGRAPWQPHGHQQPTSQLQGRATALVAFVDYEARRRARELKAPAPGHKITPASWGAPPRWSKKRWDLHWAQMRLVECVLVADRYALVAAVQAGQLTLDQIYRYITEGALAEPVAA